MLSNIAVVLLLQVGAFAITPHAVSVVDEFADGSSVDGETQSPSDSLPEEDLADGLMQKKEALAGITAFEVTSDGLFHMRGTHVEEPPSASTSEEHELAKDNLIRIRMNDKAEMQTEDLTALGDTEEGEDEDEDDYNWDDLSPVRKFLWRKLGWTQEAWDCSEDECSDDVPDTGNMEWSKLPQWMQEAAERLGFYNENLWHEQLDDQDWHQLHPSRRDEWAKLGWNEELWDEDTCANPKSAKNECDYKEWQLIESHDVGKKAAEKLGFSCKTWNKKLDDRLWHQLPDDDASRMLGLCIAKAGGDSDIGKCLRGSWAELGECKAKLGECMTGGQLDWGALRKLGEEKLEECKDKLGECMTRKDAWALLGYKEDVWNGDRTNTNTEIDEQDEVEYKLEPIDENVYEKMIPASANKEYKDLGPDEKDYEKKAAKRLSCSTEETKIEKEWHEALDEKNWRTLPSERKECWETLGFNEASWDTKQDADVTTKKNEMTPRQQECVQRLGFSDEMWTKWVATLERDCTDYNKVGVACTPIIRRHEGVCEQVSSNDGQEVSLYVWIQNKECGYNTYSDPGTCGSGLVCAMKGDLPHKKLGCDKNSNAGRTVKGERVSYCCTKYPSWILGTCGRQPGLLELEAEGEEKREDQDDEGEEGEADEEDTATAEEDVTEESKEDVLMEASSDIKMSEEVPTAAPTSAIAE